MAGLKQPASINDVEFDVLIEQTETYEADVPQYTTEVGYPVSDSIILHPTLLDVTVFITNTPVTWRQRFGGKRNADAVVEELKRLYFSKEPCTFRTSSSVFTNMAITSLSVPKKVETGREYEIPIKLQQVSTTAPKTVEVTISYGRGGATGTNAGTASTSATSSGNSSAAESKEEGKGTSSILYGLANSVGIIK